MDTDKEERIRRKAHEMWEKDGRPDGKDGHHWDEAEKLVNEEDSIKAGQPQKSPEHQPRNR